MTRSGHSPRAICRRALARRGMRAAAADHRVSWGSSRRSSGGTSSTRPSDLHLRSSGRNPLFGKLGRAATVLLIALLGLVSTGLQMTVPSAAADEAGPTTSDVTIAEA